MDLTGLNDAQKEAVQHVTGPCCVTAGAGSGKTRVLTLRIAYLIEQGIASNRIAAMTFTKKAAAEMQDRLGQTLGGLDVAEITCGTMHSICYRILREWWSQTNQSYEVLAGGQQKRIFRDLLAAPGRNNPHGMDWDCDLKYAMGRISRWKNDLREPDDIYDAVDDKRWYYLYTLYETTKDDRGLLDLDDMLQWTAKLLHDEPTIRSHWRQQWSHLLVDEAQDLNTAQWTILHLLTAPPHNLFVVGDYDQSIYAFRGAQPEFLRDFADQYPDSKQITLDLNYRSLPYVVELGNRVINCNPHPEPRNTQATRTGPIVKPHVWQPTNEDEEANQIVAFCSSLHESGTHWRDIGVLYRTNAQSQPIEDGLLNSRIPFRIVGGIGFWGRREVQDLIAYLRLLEDPHDDEAFARAVMAPSRYLGKVFVGEVLAYARTHGVDLLTAAASAPVKRYQQQRALAFVDLLREVQKWQNPADRLEAIRDLTEYDEWFCRTDSGSDEDNDHLDNLHQLDHVARKFPTTRDLLDHVETAMADRATDDANADQVTLLTVHRAKGLEWPVVIVTGCVQGVLPHRHALAVSEEEPNALEEERRLVYVAVTRARDLLVLSAPREMRNKEADVSQFLAEMGVVDDDDESELSDYSQAQ